MKKYTQLNAIVKYDERWPITGFGVYDWLSQGPYYDAVRQYPDDVSAQQQYVIEHISIVLDSAFEYVKEELASGNNLHPTERSALDVFESEVAGWEDVDLTKDPEFIELWENLVEYA